MKKLISLALLLFSFNSFACIQTVTSETTYSVAAFRLYNTAELPVTVGGGKTANVRFVTFAGMIKSPADIKIVFEGANQDFVNEGLPETVKVDYNFSSGATTVTFPVRYFGKYKVMVKGEEMLVVPVKVMPTPRGC